MTEYAYGLASPADIAGMTGKEVLQAIIDGRLPQAPISQHMSFWITEVDDGFAVFEGVPGPHLLNPAGGVHGGWALTLIDSAGGCAAHSLLPAGVGYATIETKGNFTRPITSRTGRVRAEARAVAQGRQIISTEARLLGPDGKMLAHGISTVLVLGGSSMKVLRLKRVYDPVSDEDGVRILVDRLWPRGTSKQKAKIDHWLKDISPSNALRKRFHAKPNEWEAFCSAYAAELEQEPGRSAVDELLGRLKLGPITLLYAARDESRNNAVALKAWLERANRTRY